MGLQELATTDVVTASPDTDLQSIVSEMADNDVGTVVLTENDDVVGLITDRQIALYTEDDPDISDNTAADVMTEDPITVSIEDDLTDVIDTLSDEGIRRTPVLDEDGSLYGVISLDDIFVYLSDTTEKAGQAIENQIEHL